MTLFDKSMNNIDQQVPLVETELWNNSKFKNYEPIILFLHLNETFYY